MRPLLRRAGLAAAAVLAAVGSLAGAAATAGPAAAAPRVEVRDLRVAGVPEAGGGAVSLDASLFVPASATAAHPAPAVLLAHGFGGTKASVAAQARTLAGHGYVVLTWTARGFGASGGSVHLDSPAYEVADAARLVDLLGRRADVERDGPDDPRVGVAGASYGGALGLLLAGRDHRVDAVASAITWDDLSSALDPQSASTVPAAGAATASATEGGVFKAGWAAQLLSSLLVPTSSTGATGSGAPACGRLAADLCAGYVQAAQSGVVPAALRAQLSQSSPERALAGVRAPVLLVQGEGDSLFGLDDSLANAAAARAAGAPTKVVWVPGGHDGGLDTDDLTDRTTAWFDRYLERDGSAADTRFEVDVPDASGARTSSTAAATTARTLPAPPGSSGRSGRAAATRSLALHPLAASGTSGAQPLLSPPGGRPAALTTIPGLGSVSALTSLASSAGGGSAAGGSAGAASGPGGASAPVGQVAAFTTAPLGSAATLLGSSSVELTVTSSASDAVLFASLADVAPDGTAVVPSGLVAPLRVATTPGRPVTVRVALPAVVRQVAAGHRLRLLVASTDSSFAVPTDPRTYTVSVASPLRAAVAPRDLSAGAGGASGVPWPQVALLAVVVVGAAALTGVDALRRRRAAHRHPVGAPSAVPSSGGAAPDAPVLVVRDLVKTYADGFRAVDGVSFTVGRGQVVGLLGPNGAGKTTTLRMLLGLLRPTSGSLEVLGEPVRPGSPVLARVGALVEGPGFLPHLSGLENLRAYWRATGRPAADAGVEEALAVAGLGDSVHRAVRSYSQGMRQRLGIAQAMLGRPDLLVLDEPTNGLDPPQISAMRDVLRAYAATGRTVLVSSHLLSEVEQTCTHAVVMARGKVLAAGTVADLAGGAGEVLVSLPADQVAAGAVTAAGVPGAVVVERRADGLVLVPGVGGTAAVVRSLVEAGLDVAAAAPQRHLEEVFLGLVAGSSTPADARTTSSAGAP